MLPTRRYHISRLEAFSDEHNIFFRRYGLQDPWTTAPMPFALFSGFTHFLMGPAHWTFGLASSHRRKAFETHVAPAASV
jgi:hypothetical protein